MVCFLFCLRTAINSFRFLDQTGFIIYFKCKGLHFKFQPFFVTFFALPIYQVANILAGLTCVLLGPDHEVAFIK